MDTMDFVDTAGVFFAHKVHNVHKVHTPSIQSTLPLAKKNRNARKNGFFSVKILKFADCHA